MNKCLLCNKELEGAVKSAKNTSGESFLMCANCGNVHLVITDKNGLTRLERTLNGPEAMGQMREAKKLFELAGVGINNFKDDIHSQKKSSKELEPEIDKDAAMIKERYNVLPDFLKAMVSEEKMLADYKEFKKIVKAKEADDVSSMEDIFGSIAKAIGSMLLDDCDEEECDCDECQEDDYDECDDCEDKAACHTLNGVIYGKLPYGTSTVQQKVKEQTLIEEMRTYQYVCTVIKPNGKIDSVTAKDDKDVAEMVKVFDKENVKIKELYKIELVPVEVKKETTFTINKK